MPHPVVRVSVSHPEHGQFVGLDPATDYPADDPLVKAFPWAFDVANKPRKRASVPIESATRAPGEKRKR